jgi:hypothetical protein
VNERSIVAEVLREGFRLAHRQIGLIILDLLWKLIWLVVTVSGFLGLAILFGAEFQSIEWTNTGNRAITVAAAFELLREFWMSNRSAIFIAVSVVLCSSLAIWFLLEAGFRSMLVSRGRRRFGIFLISNLLKSLFIIMTAAALAAICFGRYFSAPVSEWPQLWVDTRGAVFIAILIIGALTFLLTTFDTLVRIDAVDLLGTDLFRVTGLIGILLSFEAMIVVSCAVALGAGLLNIAGMKSAILMLASAAAAMGLLNVLHSYLLLVRYSAVGVMRQHVIEI